MSINNRRDFIKMTGMAGMSLSLAGKLSFLEAGTNGNPPAPLVARPPDLPFIPNHVTSWWCGVQDLQWPQKDIVDKIKRRAAAFAEAGIDTAVNFGFHVRFDFANYFGQLHGYYANVCEELHKYNIKWLDHYSCNNVERPRGDAQMRKLNRNQRHHTLLYHDAQSAPYAQYAGHKFYDIGQVDLRDGSRGYTPIYQFETFCYNNPGFIDMHRQYLERLMKEVPFDGIEVDDMCDYAGLYVCGCQHCRTRFKKDYGHDLPPLTDTSFWGTLKNEFDGGNYSNPAFRDWIKMRSEVITDHLKLVKSIIGKKPLMTCCSSSGPIRLNSLTLNLEAMAPHLDFFMLENVGLNVNGVNWTRTDAEALHQKDIAQKRGNAVAMAISYTIYERGGYLGWALARFWGVSNWSSTLNGRLEADPVDPVEIEQIVGPYNRWEKKHSDLFYYEGQDVTEVRLVSNSYCRDNGWRDEKGREHWDRVVAWTQQLLRHHTGYRFVRAQELEDATALSQENTPLILDGVACVSDQQFKAIDNYLRKGGTVWMAVPFGTHTEKGELRSKPLSQTLMGNRYKKLVVTESALQSEEVLAQLIQSGRFQPILQQTAGDQRWAARLRVYKGKPVIHFMNMAMTAVPHPTLKDMGGKAILKDIDTSITDNHLQFTLDTRRFPVNTLVAMSPETGTEGRQVNVQAAGKDKVKLEVKLDGIKAYAVVQPAS